MYCGVTQLANYDIDKGKFMDPEYWPFVVFATSVALIVLLIIKLFGTVRCQTNNGNIANMTSLIETTPHTFHESFLLFYDNSKLP